MKPLAVYSPGQVFSADPPDFASLGYRFLAEGDSWFSIGTLNPAKNSNLLFEMVFGQWAGAVNCASPGDTLGHMCQMNCDPNFTDLLVGRRARIWDALLVSCGGNDLIDAFGARGDGVPAEKRLLLNQAEWGPADQGPVRYLSATGWQTFCGYMRANLDHMVALRDQGPSKGVPLFLHGYAYPTPRPAGAGMKFGPWLYPALAAHGVPEDAHIPLGRLLIDRFAELMAGCAADAARYPNVHFFDSRLVPVDPAALGSTGESGDWVNEIHLTWRGYEKVAVPWAAAIEKVLAQR